MHHSNYRLITGLSAYRMLQQDKERQLANMKDKQKITSDNFCGKTLLTILDYALGRAVKLTAMKTHFDE